MKQRYVPTEEANYGGNASFVDTNTHRVYVVNDVYDICDFLNKKENKLL